MDILLKLLDGRLSTRAYSLQEKDVLQWDSSFKAVPPAVVRWYRVWAVVQFLAKPPLEIYETAPTYSAAFCYKIYKIAFLQSFCYRFY